MAYPNQMTAATLPNIRRKVQNIWWRESPALAKIILTANKKERLYDGGEFLRFPLSFARGTNRQWYTGAVNLKTNTQETLTHAQLTWAHYYDAVVITETDILKNSGKSAAINLWKTKRDELVTSIKEGIATQFYAAQAGDSMNGIDDVLNKDVAFMGIDPTDIARWNPQVDATAEAPTYLSIHNFIYQVSEDGKPEHMPDMILCNRATFSAFEAKFQPQQRLCDQEMADVGFKGQFAVDGVPVFLDVYAKGTNGAGANSMYFLNSDNVRVYLHSNDNFRTETPARPANQRVEIVQEFVTLQLGCMDRIHLGVKTAIDPTL